MNGWHPCQVVTGSNKYQKAFHVDRHSLLRMSAKLVLHGGLRGKLYSTDKKNLFCLFFV